MKMQENKLKKFNTYGNIANVLFVLVLVLGTIMLLAALAGTIYLTVSDFDIAQIVNRISMEALPEANLILPDDATISVGILYFIIVHIALAIALGAYLTKSVAKMFKNIVADKTPFTDKLVRSLKNMGIALFVYAGILLVLSMIMGAFVPHPVSTNFDINLDIGIILYGLLLFALGEIFEFGMNLQQDSESIV